jgi:hypothetical protein
MTTKELIKKLKKLHSDAKAREESGGYYDEEETHFKADHLLLDYINNQDVSDAFIDIQKWYS